MKDFSVCPRCGAKTQRAVSINEGVSEFWYECTRCNAYINSYSPQPHQIDMHIDEHTYIGNFGGYGTGKTLTSRQEIYKHIFITPNANVLIGANVASQYEQTIKRDIEADFPKGLVKYISAQKQYIDFVNGARLMFRPLDDVDKVRSYNLTMFVVIEASEVDPEVWVQLKTRLRNLNAAVLAKDEYGDVIYVRDTDTGVEVPVITGDWLKGIIESNPDSGWIRTELLNVSSVIITHGRAINEILVPDDTKDMAISAHVTSTDCNAYLPPNFIENICKNKPVWWINRFVYSSFSYAEGLVYPSAGHRIVPSFEPPSTWKRLVAADYGLSDKFVYLFGAVDEDEGICYIYKEVSTNDQNIEVLSQMFYDNAKDIPIGGYYCQPILDPKSGAKRDYNKKTLYDHFADYGIMFKGGHIQVDARVMRVNTYLESGKLRIMSCCTGLIGELNEYKFPPKKLGVLTKAMDKPEDKNNHHINPLEWICMELPSNPKNLIYGSFDRYGKELSESYKNKEVVPWQFADDINTSDTLIGKVDF